MKTIIIAMLLFTSTGLLAKNALCKRYIKKYIKSELAQELGDIKKVKLKYLTSEHTAPSGDIYHAFVKNKKNESFKLSFTLHNWLWHADQKPGKVSIFKPETFCDVSYLKIME